jgi:DNA-directed RNA polymerase specialized sigma24 family protein
MEHLRKLRLLDESGKPLGTRVEGVLERLLPRFQRQFPTFRDEVTLTEVFEEAGRRIVTREERSGPIEKLHGYAWVTLRSVATSWLRRGSSRLSQRTLGADESQAALSTVATGSGTPEQIERDILCGGIQMTADERLVCLWKTAGFSSEEIAHHRGSSAAAVDTLFSRTKQKIRTILGVQDSGAPRDDSGGAPRGRRLEFASQKEKDIETPDGESTPPAARINRFERAR